MLFTVTATFSDFTVAIEQYEADDFLQALGVFLAEAESLAAYDAGVRKSALALGHHRLTHLADMRGVWNWHLTVSLEHEDIGLLGGIIIQSDPNGPKRTHNSHSRDA